MTITMTGDPYIPNSTFNYDTAPHRIIRVSTPVIDQSLYNHTINANWEPTKVDETDKRKILFREKIKDIFDRNTISIGKPERFPGGYVSYTPLDKEGDTILYCHIIGNTMVVVTGIDKDGIAYKLSSTDYLETTPPEQACTYNLEQMIKSLDPNIIYISNQVDNSIMIDNSITNIGISFTDLNNGESI